MAKPALDLEMIGAPVGATLTYVDNKDASCVVTSLSPPKVVINGQVVSMVEAIKVVAGPSVFTGNTPFWTYKGGTIQARRLRFETYHRTE